MAGFRTVHVQRFKNITDAPFDLQDINVLVGANNSGKSSILQALHFGIGAIQSLYLEGLLRGQGAKTATVNPSRLIYVPSEDVHALGSGGRLWEPQESAVQIKFGLDTGETLTVAMRKGRNRNIQISVSDVATANTLANLEHPYTIFTPGLAGIAKAEHYVSDGVLLRTIARGDANLVLRNTLWRLWTGRTQNTKWNEFVTDFSEIFPDITIGVVFNPQTDEYIKVTVNSEAGAIPLELSGTGVLQTIQILSYIHCFAPHVIVLDEPDSHLHPNNQRLLCMLLRDIAQTRNVQVILSTHSRHVLDALQGAANFLWVRNGAVDRAAEGSELTILLDIGALDVKERLGTNAHVCIVLTEDEKTRSLRAIFEASGFDMSQTEILSYYGCTHPRNLRPLVNMIKTVNQHAVIVVHKDRDYHADEEIADWEREMRSMGADPFVTEGVDIESHLLKAEHLAELNEHLSIEEAGNLIKQALRETRDQSVQKYVNGRCDIARKAGTFGVVNLGQLATEAPRIYEDNPQRYCHGKTAISRARNLFRDAHGEDLRSEARTRHIEVPSLTVIARRAFGRRHGEQTLDI